MKVSQIVWLVLILAFILASTQRALALEPGDMFELPRVDIPFEKFSMSTKLDLMRLDDTEKSAEFKMKMNIVPALKSDGIFPDDEIILAFELPVLLDPAWLAPDGRAIVVSIPEKAFGSETPWSYKLSGTPEALGVQIFLVRDGVVEAVTTDAIREIRGTAAQDVFGEWFLKISLSSIFKTEESSFLALLLSTRRTRVVFLGANGGGGGGNDGTCNGADEVCGGGSNGGGSTAGDDPSL